MNLAARTGACSMVGLDGRARWSGSMVGSHSWLPPRSPLRRDLGFTFRMSGGAAFPPPLAAPLRISALVKWFGDTLALDDLSLAVPAQSCFGLVGPNGSGKSTTLRSVIGLVRPDAGVIEVCGHDVATDLRDARRMIRGELNDAMPQTDVFGALTRRSQEHFRRGRV